MGVERSLSFVHFILPNFFVFLSFHKSTQFLCIRVLPLFCCSLFLLHLLLVGDALLRYKSPVLLIVLQGLLILYMARLHLHLEDVLGSLLFFLLFATLQLRYLLLSKLLCFVLLLHNLHSTLLFELIKIFNLF